MRPRFSRNLSETDRSWWPAVCIFALIVGYLTLQGLSSTAYDDSYFFKRFALNALEHGVFAWNIEDGPVYGSTSQLFQWVATVVVAFAPAYYITAIKVFNASCVLVLGSVVLRWCSRATERPVDGALIGLLTVANPIVLTTIGTGMETALTLAIIAVVLTRFFPHEGSPSGPLEAAGLTLVIYLCRPDAAAVSAVAYGVSQLQERRIPWRYGLALAAGMGVILLALWGYYGTPFPLPFYMKTAGVAAYGEHVQYLGGLVKREHATFVSFVTAPLVFIAATRGPRRSVALLASTLVFWAYHLAMTNEIMGYHGRFYAPGVVGLGLAAASAWDHFNQHRARWLRLAFVVLWCVGFHLAYRANVIPTNEGFFLRRVSWEAYLGMGLPAIWLLLRPRRVHRTVDLAIALVCLSAGTVGWKPPKKPRVRPDHAILRRHAREVTTVRGLYELARCLPDVETVYHSEMGVPGLVLRRARVVDLVGIVSRETVLEGKSFQELCAEDRPEAIFLPHKNYRELNAEIRSSPCFEDYVRVVDRSSAPLHIRKDLADSFSRCATNLQRWRRGGP